MKKTAIFFGSSTGNTEDAAKRIQNIYGADQCDLFDVSKKNNYQLSNYELLIFGSSTWGAGDIQDDFDNFLYDLRDEDLSGRKVALFGMGDQFSHGDTFANALGEIYRQLEKKNVEIVGFTSTEGYDYSDSESVVDGKFVGLVLDEDNQSQLTESRIINWVNGLKN